MNGFVSVLNIVTMVLAGLGTVAAVICVIRDRMPDWATLICVALLELALLLLVVANLVLLAGSTVPVDGFSLVAYLIVLALIVPGTVGWAFWDRTRFGVATIAVACLIVPVMILRTQQIWEVAHAR